MGLPIVENLSGLCGNSVNLFRPKINFGAKIKKFIAFYIKLPIYRPPPWAAVMLYGRSWLCAGGAEVGEGCGAPRWCCSIDSLHNNTITAPKTTAKLSEAELYKIKLSKLS